MRAIVAGTARIVVRVEEIRDTVSVTVTPLPVDHVVITSTLADTVLLRARGQVIAYPYAADGPAADARRHLRVDAPGGGDGLSGWAGRDRRHRDRRCHRHVGRQVGDR